MRIAPASPPRISAPFEMRLVDVARATNHGETFTAI